MIRRSSDDSQTPESVSDMLERGANLVVEENWVAARSVLEKALEMVGFVFVPH